MAANRWAIAVAGVVMQVALGAVYAWSVFRDPLAQTFGWSISQVTLTFSITIGVLGVSAFAGGLWMQRAGPRRVAVAAGVLYGVGVAMASLSAGRLWALYLTYGVLGGVGIGLGYIVPVAVLVKWFPDRRGFITGLAVAGFGAGALVTAPVATWLIEQIGVMATFAALGGAYLVMMVPAALFMRNPPEGWTPGGKAGEGGAPAGAFTLGEALRTWQWYALWGMLFLNVTAGIGVISQAAPMAQEIAGATALAAAGLVSATSVANACGRLGWAWLSDGIGRRWAFFGMFAIQAVLFFAMPQVRSFAWLAVVASAVLACYGGGFGTMPAFAADCFGARHVGSIYGLMLTAWSAAGVLGPLLVARVREATGGYGGAFTTVAWVMVAGMALALGMGGPGRARRTLTNVNALGRPEG